MKKVLLFMLLVCALLLGCAAAETDFSTLCAEAKLESEDVCAWLEIPGTEISLPVMQSADNDSFYLDHDIWGQENVNGALYTEASYNARDFTDPVTIVYGHRMNSGAMFGNLQMHYSGKNAFDAHRKIILYLPDEKLEYTVFAAIPFSRIHILHYYDFEKQRIFEKFFDEVFAIRSLIAIRDEQARPSYQDRVLVLSTCIKGDKSQRFLVMAALD